MPSQFGGIEVNDSEFGGTPVVEQPPAARATPPKPQLTGDDDAIIRSLGADPRVIQASPWYQAAKQKWGSGFAVPGFAVDKPEERPGAVAQTIGAVGKGALDPFYGLAQLGQHGFGDERNTPYVDLLMRFREQNQRQNLGGDKGYNKAAEFAGAMVPSLVMPGGATMSGARLVPALGAGAAQGAAVGALAPVTEGNDYWRQKAIDTGLGLAGGVTGTAVGRGITRGAKALASWFKGPLPEEEAAAFAKTLEGRVQSGSWGDLSDLEQAAQGGSGRAKQLLGELHAAADPEAIERAAVRLRNFRTGQESAELYGKVGQIVRDKQLGDVPLDRGLATIDKMLAELRQAKAPDAPLVHYLEGVRARLVPQPAAPAGPPPTNIRDFVQWQAAQEAPASANNSYELIHELVGDLGDTIRAQRGGANALLGPKAAGRLQLVRNALRSDIDAFVEKSGVPELQAAQKAADEHFRTVRVPFRDPAIARAGATDEPDTILNMFVKGGNRGALAQKFYNALDPRGRAAVQSQMLDKVIEDATDVVTGKVNAERFLEGAHRINKAFGVFFQGDDQRAFQGLVNLMQHAASVDRVPFGQIGVGAEVAGAAGHALGFPGAGKAVAGLGVASGLAKLLLKTEGGRRMLYSMASAKPLSPELGRIYGALERGNLPALLGKGTATVPGEVRIHRQPVWQPPGMAVGGRVREATLRSLGYEPLRYAGGGRTINVDLGDRPGEFWNQPIDIGERVRRWRSGEAGLPEPTPPPPPPAQQPASLRDLVLGGQAGMADLARMLTKPAEAIYGGRLASGRPLSEAEAELVGPDPKELEARQGPANRALQFAGRMPVDVARYGLATAAAGGNPLALGAAGASGILGGAAAEALKADTPEEALTHGIGGALTALPGGYGVAGGALSNAIGAQSFPEAMERALEGGTFAGALHYGPGAILGGARKVAEALPTHEALREAEAGARERLRASGALSGATLGNLGSLDAGALKDAAILTGSQLGGGLYTMGEAAAARARQVKQALLDRRTLELTPQEQEKFAQARQASPELNEVGDLMMPIEVRKIIASPQNVEAVSRMLRVIPDSAKLAAAAKMGVSKLGWYRGSSQALMDVFGDDAPRFAQLLAAMSPQTSVESNLFNALNTWKNWIAEGRPTDAAAIKRIMGQSVQGSGTEKSVLDAWLGNTQRVLGAKDPMSVTLSGPKVDSFYHNLRDDVFRVTNDAWMANALGIVQDAFSGSPSEIQLAQRDPGMTWRYAAASARVRDAALQAGMLPSQGQETIWSTAMQLYELARKNGMHPREVLERGMLTPEIIRGAPDFSTLLKEPQYRRILEAGGYGPQLSAMQPFQFPQRQVPMSAGEQEALGGIADILGETARVRGLESQSRIFPSAAISEYPTSAFARTQLEAVPGHYTGILSGMTGLPYGEREYLTSRGLGAFKDPRGRDVLQTAVGLNTTPMESGIGAFKERGKPWDTNPARSLGAHVPIVWAPPERPAPRVWEGDWKPQVPPEIMAKLEGTAATHGAMLGQAGVGVPVLVPRPEETGAKNFRLELPKKPKLTPEAMRALAEKYPKMAYAHTGPAIEVLDINDLNLTQRQRDNVGKMVNATKRVDAKNAGTYIDYANEWAQQPGSQAVTAKMMRYIDQMSPDDQAALDQAVRQPASELFSLFSTTAQKKKLPMRQDFLNLLATMRDQGVTGVREGIKSGAFLPGLVGAVLLPHLLREPEPAEPHPVD